VIRVTHRTVVALLLPALLVPLTQPLAAQQADSTARKTFFVPSDAVWLGAFALGSYGLSRVDPKITHYFQQPKQQQDGALRSLAESFSRVQETTLTLGGLATYGIARLVRSPDVADVALHATEAVVAASLTSQVIRGPLGRARPDATNPKFENQYDFHWFKGFTSFDHRAFPSIHASSSFAAGTVLLLETRRRAPQATWYVAPVALALAAGPAYSRVYLARHWASDILMGAFFGTFYGARIVSYSHDHPDNRFDRFFLGKPAASGLQVLPVRHGVSFSYARSF
jgi:membrane-associated phospholipid phosphatase